MESYNNPFSFASDADLMPFWNHSDFNILVGDCHNSSSCHLSSYQPATEPLDACFKSQSTPTSVVDAAAPVNHHNHHPVELIIPPPSIQLAPLANQSSSINYGHNYNNHYNNQIDEPHNHPMISEFNFPNPAHKWELPQPMMAFKTSSMNNSHQNHHHHHPATSSSSSSSYSVELDEALSLAPEDEEEESHDAPFLIPSPPSSHHHHSHHHQQHHHHPSSAHFLPPSPSSSSSGVPLPVIESTSSLKNPQFKRLREEVYNDQTDMSIDCQESMANGGGAGSSPTTSSVDEEDPTGGFKLPASKSPIMEAMVVCALNGWGIDIIKNNRPTSTNPAEVVFRVFDFNRYYKISRLICSKQRPTDDLGSRIKSLRRWFVNFPKKRDRCENAFFLQVKPTIAKKVNEIIERNSRSMGLVKRSRKQ